ncbi:Transducin/WD40 repeat-like superfamily protein [Zea mays]|uniref:Transducin/WD40 repeat-like superfamily protein n=1 Tax=Zea mays TaxID=4577 RepID=A0A1D6G9P3_MAIZE|nr:Transducin/WD40 repeat-like superfamily protein [Zea mays]AQK99828.1 Transducin/WD40 repeat-like superfamily protein [Zea mays]
MKGLTHGLRKRNDKPDSLELMKGMVHLYDITLQRRPAIFVDFGESPINAADADPNGHDVYVGTGIWDLASFDMRIGCYI